MVSFFSSSRPHFHAWIDAIDRTQAVVEFGLDGTVRWANGYFLTTFGYRLEEVRGRSHRLFVDEETAESEAYDIFWSELRRGGTHQSRIRHVGVDGTEIWLHATYAPTFDRYGRVKGIILIGADVTPEVWAQAQLAEGARKALGNAYGGGSQYFSNWIVASDPL